MRGGVLKLLRRDFDRGHSVARTAAPETGAVDSPADDGRSEDLDLCDFAGQLIERRGVRSVAGEELVIERVDECGCRSTVDHQIGIIFVAEETVVIARPVWLVQEVPRYVRSVDALVIVRSRVHAAAAV